MKKKVFDFFQKTHRLCAAYDRSFRLPGSFCKKSCFLFFFGCHTKVDFDDDFGQREFRKLTYGRPPTPPKKIRKTEKLLGFEQIST